MRSVVVILALLISLLALGATNPNYVTSLPVSAVTVAAGKPATVAISFRVAKNFHINSHKPNSDLLIPTELKLDPPTDVGVGQISYPPGMELALSFDPAEKLSVYSGDFSIQTHLSAVRTAVPGRYRIHGELHYQACNDRACFPPQKIPVTLDVTVLRSRIAADSPPRRNPAQSPHAHSTYPSN